SRVEFEVGSGVAFPTEIVLVPMLFVLPAPIVPLAVAVGLVLGQLPDYLRRRIPAERAVVAISSAWFALGPAIVFSAFGEPSARRRTAWGVRIAALLAQSAFAFGSAGAGEWFAPPASPRQLIQPMIWIFTVDTLIAPLGLAAAVAAMTNKAALVLPLPLLALI